MDCPYCAISSETCPLHRTENRMQKIVLTIEVFLPVNTVKKDAEAVELLKNEIAHIAEQTGAKNINGKVTEHGPQGKGKIQKEVLGKIEYKDGDVKGGTNREMWQQRYQAAAKKIIGAFLAENVNFHRIQWDHREKDLTIYFITKPDEPFSVSEFVLGTPTRILLDKLHADLSNVFVSAYGGIYY